MYTTDLIKILKLKRLRMRLVNEKYIFTFANDCEQNQKPLFIC